MGELDVGQCQGLIVHHGELAPSHELQQALEIGYPFGRCPGGDVAARNLSRATIAITGDALRHDSSNSRMFALSMFGHDAALWLRYDLPPRRHS
jgi:hypothetical protein